MDIGYVRVLTVEQDFVRQIDALRALGISADLVYVDKKIWLDDKSAGAIRGT